MGKEDEFVNPVEEFVNFIADAAKQGIFDPLAEGFDFGEIKTSGETEKPEEPPHDRSTQDRNATGDIVTGSSTQTDYDDDDDDTDYSTSDTASGQRVPLCVQKPTRVILESGQNAEVGQAPPATSSVPALSVGKPDENAKEAINAIAQLVVTGVALFVVWKILKAVAKPFLIVTAMVLATVLIGSLFQR